MMPRVLTYRTAEEARADSERVLDGGDIVLVPSQAVVAVYALGQCWAVTGETAGFEVAAVPFLVTEQPESLRAALAIVGQDDTGYRPHPAYAPTPTRQRPFYEVSYDYYGGGSVKAVVYTEPGTSPLLVGWLLESPDHRKTTVHTDGTLVHTDTSFGSSRAVVQALIDHDLKATAFSLPLQLIGSFQEERRRMEAEQAAEPPATPVEYEPNMED